MQKFILIILILGLAFFLYLLQTGEISKNAFNIKKLEGDTNFVIKKNNSDLFVKSSDIYAIIKDNEYKIFSFSGDDFHKLLKLEYPLEKYRVPLSAVDAITGTWIGNRYVFYILEKSNTITKEVTYEIYKAEYPTDEINKLKFYLIKTVDKSEVDGSFEVKY